MDRITSLIAGVIYATSLGLLFFTTWTTSTRGLFLAVLPLFISMLLAIREAKQPRGVAKYVLLVGALFVFMALIHHLYIFLVVFIAAAVAAWIVEPLLTNKTAPLRNPVNWIILTGMAGIPILLMILSRFSQGIARSFYDSVKTFGIEYARSLGIFAVFLAVSAIVLLFKPDRTRGERYLLIALLFLSPIMMLEVYGVNLWLLPAALASAIGIMEFVRLLPRKSGMATLSAIIIVGLFTSALFQNYHPNILKRNVYDKNYMDLTEQQVNSWLRDNTQGKVISIADIKNQRAQTMIPCRVYFGDVIPLMCGFISPDQVLVKPISPLSPSFWSDYPYASLYEFRYSVGALIRYWGLGHPRITKLQERADLRYYVAYDQVPDDAYLLAKTAKVDRDKVYTNGDTSVWYLK
jgi:hypothetical protein